MKEAGSALGPLSLGTVQVSADLPSIWLGVGCCGTPSGLAWKENMLVGSPSVSRLLRPNCSETGPHELETSIEGAESNEC